MYESSPSTSNITNHSEQRTLIMAAPSGIREPGGTTAVPKQISIVAICAEVTPQTVHQPVPWESGGRLGAVIHIQLKTTEMKINSFAV